MSALHFVAEGEEQNELITGLETIMKRHLGEMHGAIEQSQFHDSIEWLLRAQLAQQQAQFDLSLIMSAQLGRITLLLEKTA